MHVVKQNGMHDMVLGWPTCEVEVFWCSTWEKSWPDAVPDVSYE